MQIIKEIDKKSDESAVVLDFISRGYKYKITILMQFKYLIILYNNYFISYLSN